MRERTIAVNIVMIVSLAISFFSDIDWVYFVTFLVVWNIMMYIFDKVAEMGETSNGNKN